MEGESSNSPLRLGGVSEVTSTSSQLGDGADKDERYALNIQDAENLKSRLPNSAAGTTSSPTKSSPTIYSPAEVGCDDCCSLLLKDYSDDFWEVFYDVLLFGRLTCKSSHFLEVVRVVFSLPGSRLQVFYSI
ncbi:hypothetical protein YC2023_010085 [Brassica napus]